MISRPVKSFVLWQSLILILLILSAAITLDRATAGSATVGALIAYLAMLYLTLQTFRVNAAAKPHLAVRAFYRGVAGRFTLATVFFGLAFVYLPWLEAPALFLGFGVILITQWIGSARLATKLAQTRQSAESA